MKNYVIPFNFTREEVRTGILHIGVGNFHRAHEEYYTNLLLQDADQQHWGICGVMLLPSDEYLYKILQEQQNQYTLTVCGRDGKDKAYQIASLIELYWAMEQSEEIIRKMAAKEIRIITLTITEGGYNIDKSTGAFKLDDEQIQYDLTHPERPKTVFGFVAEGLRRRMQRGNGPITILSCDNLQHNGNTAKRSFTAFFEAQDKELAAWVAENVTFPNSMVDRITPATTPADIERLNAKNGIDCKAPVYCEDFIQWVIEDKFIAGRPAWERVGVEFTDDVTAYENMKLSLLNASHTLLCFPAFLSGYRKVDAAMRDEQIEKLVRTFMDKDVTPYVPAPTNTDLALYKQTLIERFGNQSVSDQVSRLCFDSVSKFPVYIMPNLIKMIEDGADLTRQAYLFAAYRHYLKYQVDDNGDRFEVNEPWLTDEDYRLIQSEDAVDFLGLSAFQSTNLKEVSPFVTTYLSMVDAIRENGAKKTLININNQNN